MLIEEKALRHWIDNFYGYGSWHARFWFIGYEEGGGEVPEEVAEKLNYFYNTHDPTPGGILSNIRELYKHVSVRLDGPKAGLFNNRYEYRFDSGAIQNSVWKNLIAFVHGYKNESLPDLLAYQKQNFASASAHSEALIRLYPLPSPHSHSWYYSWLDLPLGFLKSRALYQEHVYQRRIHNILSNIRTCKPEVVLMYGMTNVNTLRKSVQEFFPGAKFKMIKSTIGRQIPQHHRADLDGTTILITTQIPALRHNRIETGFDWEAFGKRAKSEGSR